ncbi:hypothetical protein F4604DRAFT_2007749 [Suillus subluteus]|nr:hypothetical protein F4604DRAFT_2007749 [Suillus subluteus]
MSRFTIDPNLEQCPDFTSAIFQGSHTPLLGPTVNDTQAAVTLQTIWVATNATLKAQWQQQLDTDALAATKQRCLLAEADERRLAAQKLQDAVIAEEDRKKNRIHHIPIPDWPRPTCAAATVLICDFTLQKVDKAQFIELYYWTNKGLADAKLDFHNVDDDGMIPMATADGTTTWLPTSATCPAYGVTADHLLSPLDFARVIPCYIASLEQRGWENSCILMLAQFFGALMLHDYWTSDDVFEQHTLLTCQEEQCHAWHQAIPQPSGAWNISVIDEVELSRTYDRICHPDRMRTNNELNSKVRSFTETPHINTNLFIYLPPSFLFDSQLL